MLTMGFEASWVNTIMKCIKYVAYQIKLTESSLIKFPRLEV